MSNADKWFELAVTDRKGTFRGMEIGMPLRDALALESGELSRAKGSVLLRSKPHEMASSEVEIGFARSKGLDRVVSVRFRLEAESGLAEVESAFELVCQHFGRLFGPPAPAPAPAAARAGRAARRLWLVQGRELPTQLQVAFENAVTEEMVRKASLSVVMERVMVESWG